MGSPDPVEKARLRFVESVATVLEDRAKCPDSTFAEGLPDRIRALASDTDAERAGIAELEHARAKVSAAETAALNLQAALATAAEQMTDAGFEEAPGITAARVTLNSALKGARDQAESRLKQLDVDLQKLEIRVTDMTFAHRYLSFVNKVREDLAVIVKEEPDRRLPLLRAFSRTLRGMKLDTKQHGALATHYIMRYGAASGKTATEETLVEALEEDAKILATCFEDARKII